jgi:hypothetical protein
LRERYEQEPKLANELISTGESSVDETINKIELAVWTAIANIAISLDESIVRP